jgi:hypothetical protein
MAAWLAGMKVVPLAKKKVEWRVSMKAVQRVDNLEHKTVEQWE